MNFWQALVVALVPTAGVLLSVFVSTRDLDLRRKLESTDKFFDIVMLSNARSREREHVGTAEQVAAVHLLADFGKTEDHLKNASRAALEELHESLVDNPSPVAERIRDHVNVAIARING